MIKGRLSLTPYVLSRYSGVPRLRALYWHIVRGWESEVCQQCGRPVRVVWWCHDDRLWELVTGHIKPSGKEAAAGIWCPSCFDEAARDRAGWVEWAPVNLRHLREESS